MWDDDSSDEVEEGSGEETDEDGKEEFQKERDHIPDPKRPRAKDKGEDKPKVAKDVMEHLAAKAEELEKHLAAKAEDEDEDESKVKEPNKRQKLEVYHLKVDSAKSIIKGCVLTDSLEC